MLVDEQVSASAVPYLFPDSRSVLQGVLAFLTAALAVVLEEAVMDAGALGGLAVTGSET
jgi:hypothetical protein